VTEVAQSFQLIEKLVELGVSATDVKRLKEAGFYTVESLFMRPRKVRARTWLCSAAHPLGAPLTERGTPRPLPPSERGRAASGPWVPWGERPAAKIWAPDPKASPASLHCAPCRSWSPSRGCRTPKWTRSWTRQRKCAACALLWAPSHPSTYARYGWRETAASPPPSPAELAERSDASDCKIKPAGAGAFITGTDAAEMVGARPLRSLSVYAYRRRRAAQEHRSRHHRLTVCRRGAWRGR
jgi:hypothetical protein